MSNGGQVANAVEQVWVLWTMAKETFYSSIPAFQQGKLARPGVIDVVSDCSGLPGAGMQESQPVLARWPDVQQIEEFGVVT